MANPIPIFRPVVGTSLQDNIAQPIEVSGVMAPSRPIAIISTANQNNILQLQNTASDLQSQIDDLNTSTAPTAPAACTDVEAVESPYKTADGSVLDLVSVSFVNTDPNFATADIYFTGYNGSATPQFVSSGTESPISFLTNITKETVTVTVVALDSTGDSLPFANAPTTTVTLNGVPSAPPPPSIVANSFILTPIGASFSFDVEGGLLEDIISSYNVYRNTTNTFAGATQIQSIAQPSTNTGTIQVQDVFPQTSTTVDYYYWVTAVNTSGMESTPSGVGLAAQGGIPQEVTGVYAAESAYKTNDGSLLSLVAVDFVPVAGDAYFSSVNIYFTGYNGNTLPQLMNNSSTSPAEFLCETTGETVTVTVVAVSANGNEASFTSAPTCFVTLNGVTTAPPYPSISQAQVALDGNLGWQFAFNIIGGLEFDQIDSYRIYHSESNVTPVPPSCYYRAIPQPATNVGQEVVQEITGDILFYWVSAVNTTGLESELTPVPFTYIDPGSPPPNLPAPVATTNNYSPVVSLNGWGESQHVGFWETQNSDNGTNFGYSSTQVCEPFVNPGAACDGNQTTCATWSLEHNAAYAGCVWSFSNFPGLTAGATLTSATLSILSDVVPTAGPVHGEGSIYYSTDGGSTWTQVYLASYQTESDATRPEQTDTVTLPTTINPAQLQVMACVHSHDDIQMDVYEISLSITQTSNAGPSAVTGVTASLVGGDVQIGWNGLVPLTRTDIINYQVYRALHGAGYLNSHLQTTVTPVVGQASYSWTDVEAHDGSWDYWVICQNSTGYSPASIVVTLQSATSVLYVSGATLESLQPAQAGADVTSQNTSNDTANVNGVPSATVAANATTAATAVTQQNSTDYLTNSDKTALMQQYSAVLAQQTQLDSTATSLSVSHSAYDAAVAAINSTLIAAGAPSNWASIWPDGTTFGPAAGIQSSLAADFATVSGDATALQYDISAAQAAAAQSAAVSSAVATATANAPAVVSSLPTLPNSTYPSGKMIWDTTTTQLYLSTGTTWTSLAVPAVNISGTLEAAQVAYTSGSTVQSLQPAQAGADVTADNTAANTNAVGSISSTAVTNTVQSTGGINFASGLHSNKNLDNIANGPSGTYTIQKYYLQNGGAPQWFLLGTWTFTNGGTSLGLTYNGGVGYNITAVQQCVSTVTVRSSNDTGAPNISGASWYSNGGSDAILGLSVVAASGNNGSGGNWNIYVELNSYTNGHWTISPAPGDDFVWSGSSASNPGAASSTVVIGTGGHVLNAGGTGLDAVNDGTSYQRISSTYVSGGVPLILEAGQIAANIITGNQIAAGTITANNILSGTITAGQIAAGAIGASQIAANAITANMITSGTLNAATVDVINLSASNISTGTLSANMVLFPDGSELTTASRVLMATATCTSSVTPNSSGAITAIPGLGWTTTTLYATDVYNISALLLMDSPASDLGSTLTIALVLNGNLEYFAASTSFTWTAPTYLAMPFIASVTGLSPGSNTLQLYVGYPWSTGTGPLVEVGCYATCQRIY
jgi:hypothetical protein